MNAYSKRVKTSVGKSDDSGRPAQPPNKCPECSSTQNWKDGIRYTKTGQIQRYICRDCGYRFSESNHMNKNSESYSTERRVCVSDNEMENLAKVEIRTESRLAGATKPLQKITNTETIVTIFKDWMQRQGYKTSTCEAYAKRIKILLRKHTDLWNPENVKEVIAKQKTWGTGFKKCMVNAYERFMEMEELTWKKPRYKHEQKIPFVPLEQEINQLIAGCGKKMAVFLQGLKETGADPGELWNVEWKDIGIVRRVVTINHPVKGHNPRTLPMSKEWIAMLQRLPINSERIFAKNYHNHYENFRNQRKRVAAKVGNPRILQIKFTSFRHWKGTMEYHQTKDILHVKTLLGHKCVKNTEIYVNIDQQLFTGFNDQFISKVAKTIEEDRELIEAGFEFVTERDRNKIYRKRK
jgi:integrase